MQWSQRKKRTNKQKMIKANKDDEQSDWDMNLPKLTYTFNTSVQESTKHTPFEMMFGRKPKLPIDIALPNAEILREEGETEERSQADQEMGDLTILDNQETVKNTRRYLNKLKLTMKESHSKAALNRNAAMDKHKLFYDRKIKKFSYNIGDYVLCTTDLL